MNTFKLRISAPEETVYDGEACYCGVFTAHGSLGIKAHHEPMVGLLADHSQITWRDQDNQTHSVLIQEGMFVFSKNSCTVAAELPGK